MRHFDAWTHRDGDGFARWATGASHRVRCVVRVGCHAAFGGDDATRRTMRVGKMGCSTTTTL
jgi:hypothetical protein